MKNIIDEIYNQRESLLLYSFRSEQELISSLQELSHNFTRARQDIHVYTNSERLISAYTLFYMTTNAYKLGYVLNQLNAKTRDELAHATWVDFGCGPGTYALGIEKAFGEAFKGKYIGIDSSSLMLKQAKRISPLLSIPVEFHERVYKQKEEDTVLLISNSLNEMSDEQLNKLVKSHSYKWIFIIEPGTPASFSRVKPLREELIKADYFNYYPCPSQKECPMQSGDWCHQVMYQQYPVWLERLFQKAKLDRKKMPMIAHLYGPEKPDEGIKRVVQMLGETKFSVNWRVCHEGEAFNSIDEVELLKKKLKRPQLKVLKEFNEGTQLQYKEVKTLDNKTRIELED